MGSHGESDAVVGRGRAAWWPDTWVTDSARAPRGPAALRPVHVQAPRPRSGLWLWLLRHGDASVHPSLRAPCESVTSSLAGRDASRPVPGQDHVENLWMRFPGMESRRRKRGDWFADHSGCPMLRPATCRRSVACCLLGVVTAPPC